MHLEVLWLTSTGKTWRTCQCTEASPGSVKEKRKEARKEGRTDGRKKGRKEGGWNIDGGRDGKDERDRVRYGGRDGIIVEV